MRTFIQQWSQYAGGYNIRNHRKMPQHLLNEWKSWYDNKLYKQYIKAITPLYMSPNNFSYLHSILSQDLNYIQNVLSLPSLLLSWQSRSSIFSPIPFYDPISGQSEAPSKMCCSFFIPHPPCFSSLQQTI